MPKSGEPLPGYQGQGSAAGSEDDGKDEDTTLTQEQLLELEDGDLVELGETYGLSLGGVEKDDMVVAILEAQDEAVEEETKVALLNMKREELEAFATEQGIEDPKAFPNKPALADAVLEAAKDK